MTASQGGPAAQQETCSLMQPFQNEKAQLIMTLRGMGIIDADVLAAIEQVPREIFVSRALLLHCFI